MQTTTPRFQVTRWNDGNGWVPAARVSQDCADPKDAAYRWRAYDDDGICTSTGTVHLPEDARDERILYTVLSDSAMQYGAVRLDLRVDGEWQTILEG